MRNRQFLKLPTMWAPSPIPGSHESGTGLALSSPMPCKPSGRAGRSPLHGSWWHDSWTENPSSWHHHAHAVQAFWSVQKALDERGAMAETQFLWLLSHRSFAMVVGHIVSCVWISEAGQGDFVVIATHQDMLWHLHPEDGDDVVGDQSLAGIAGHCEDHKTLRSTCRIHHLEALWRQGTTTCQSMVARARPAVPLGLWSITSSLRGNFYVPCLHKFIKWFADNDVAHRN